MNPNRFTSQNSARIQRTIDTNNRILDKLLFAIVVSSESFDAEKWQWEYTIKPAIMDDTDLSTISRNDITFTAYSISELGNTTTIAAYGTDITTLPETIRPVKIPNGTPVICVANTSSNSKFHYLIVNTQAITGPCA